MFPFPSPVCCTHFSCQWKSKLANFPKPSHLGSSPERGGPASRKRGRGDVRTRETHHSPSRKHPPAPGGEAQRHINRLRRTPGTRLSAAHTAALPGAAAGTSQTLRPLFPAPFSPATNDRGTLCSPSTRRSRSSHPGGDPVMIRGSFSLFGFRFSFPWAGRGRRFNFGT